MFLPAIAVSPSYSQFHFLVHSYGNRGQGMRGFSRSIRNLAFCVAAAQAAATEARGEIEFSWNSPVSLALGWPVRLDWPGLSAACKSATALCWLAGQRSWCVRGCWFGSSEGEPGLMGTMPTLTCH